MPQIDRAQLAHDFMGVFKMLRVSPEAYSPETAETIYQFAEALGGTVMGGYPAGVKRSPELKQRLGEKLEKTLSFANITKPFKYYIRRQFETGFDSGIDPDITRWMGFDPDNGKYGIFGEPKEARIIELKFVNDMPNTIRSLEDMLGPENEAVAYYIDLYRRWSEATKRKNRRK